MRCAYCALRSLSLRDNTQMPCYQVDSFCKHLTYANRLREICRLSIQDIESLASGLNQTQSSPVSIIPRMETRHTARENLADTLRVYGINPTHQRIEIAHALFSRQQRLSADQVMAIVNERHSETSKATVYNTLKLFVAKALNREVIVDPTRVFYDPNTEPHHHLYGASLRRATGASDRHILGRCPHIRLA
jgi:Fur family iron response transcriptional regulator